MQTSYEGFDKQPRRVPLASVRAVLEVMGATRSGTPPAGATVLGPGDAVDLSGVVEVHTEDGGAERIAGGLPRDLPFGYHRLVGADGTERPLVLSPGDKHRD